jgi:predicted permease
MSDEMRFHLDLEIDDRNRGGMSPDEARRTAFVDFGGVERYKEDARTARGVRPIEDLVQDVAYATRVFRRSPGFTIAALLAVAVGIAGTTVVFSAADALLLRPLPVAEPGRLFVLSELWKGGDRSLSTSMGEHMYSYRHYLRVRDATTSVFQGLAGFRYGNASFRVGNTARSLSSIAATPNYFRVLGVRPALGRFFGDSTSPPGAQPEAVISYDFWQAELAGDSTILGRPIWVDSRAMSIVGVAPRAFHGTMTGLVADLWIPATMDVSDAGDSLVADPRARLGPVTMFGRLAPGLSPEQASRMLTVIAPYIQPDAPWQRMRGMVLDPMTGVPAMGRGAVEGFTVMLLVTAGLVLAIAIANIAGMLLARGAHRRREIAVRLSLGAWRGRLVRQLVTESILLCAVGAAAGVLLASLVVSLLPTIQPPIGIRVNLDLRLDTVVLAVSLVTAVVTGVASGLMPALAATRVDVLSGLRGTSAGGRKSSRARTGSVVSQLAMSLVLLVTAGLFVRALRKAVQVNPGLDPRHVVAAEISVESHGYTRERGAAFYRMLMQRLRGRPEVESAALGEWTPLALTHNGGMLTAPNGTRFQVTWGVTDGEYFATMRIPLLEGQAFRNVDRPGATPTIIVNETFATRMWPGESPIGKVVQLLGDHEVVGVVKDGKYRSLDEGPTAYAFFPFAQRYSPRMTIYVRARSDEATALNTIREEVSALDPNIALEKEGPLAQQLEVYYLPQRAAAWFVGIFGLIGLALASLGVYGVISYHVAQRTRDLGIMLALGAERRDVIASVLRQGVTVIGTGLAIGLVLSLGVGRLAAGFLYGVRPTDPETFLLVAVLLGVVGMVATYLPARRAARVDPMISLRAD